jgi:hypothetical protein
VTADKDVSARAVSDVECAVVAELVVRIRDRGPEPDWHTNRSLFGPWCRFEAELVGDAGVRSTVVNLSTLLGWTTRGSQGQARLSLPPVKRQTSGKEELKVSTEPDRLVGRPRRPPLDPLSGRVDRVFAGRGWIAAGRRGGGRSARRTRGR